MTYLVMALALALGFTQCKKEQTNTTAETQGVQITRRWMAVLRQAQQPEAQGLSLTLLAMLIMPPSVLRLAT